MRLTFKKLLLIAGLAFVCFLGWGAWQLFGPGPPIVVSKTTTYITSPLRPDGLPDYEKYVLEKSREGVTPENNAAVLFWQAMGPGDMALEDFAAVAKEIGLETIPLPDDCLKEIYGNENRERVTAWLEQEDILPRADDEEQWQGVTDPDEVVDDLLDQAMERPWTSEQIPPLAEWAAANEKPFALLTSATQRPQFFSPAPELLNDKAESLIFMSMESIHLAREAAWALRVRAMWHVGEGRPDKAWNDIITMYRISRHISRGTTIIELLVSIAIEGIANRNTLALLDSPSTSPVLARQIRQYLQSLNARKSMSESFDQTERIGALSAMLSLRDGNIDDMGLGGGFEAVARAAVFDWNIPLREMNHWYNELSAAAKLPTWSARQKAMETIEAQLSHVGQSPTPGRMLGAAISRNVRSEMMAEALVALMLPATSAACQAEDRGNTELDLIRLAAALAEYRAEHGEYPENLESLVPDILDKLPTDLYHDNPFAYRRTPNGYLLYSLGPNGQDDGGSNEQMHKYKGYSTDLEPIESLRELLGDDLPMVEDESADPASDEPATQHFGENDNLDDLIPAGADDFSIRLPLPKLELPKAKK